MDSRTEKYNETDKMSRVSKNSNLYKQINDCELDNFKIRSNATVIGNQEQNIDIEQIKKILDKRYNDTPRRRSIRVDIDEEERKIERENTKEYDLTKVLEKAKDEMQETYEENRNKKLRNTQYDILNNLKLDNEKDTSEPDDEPKKLNPEENLMNLINTITINESKKKDNVDPLDILTDLKGEDNTEVYTGMETSITSITEIREKEKTDDEKKNEIDNSFYTNNLFKKKDFEDESDFVENEKIGLGIKLLIVLVITIFLIGLFLFIKSYI